MAVGNPQVATDASGPATIVVDGETAVVDPPRDATPMGLAIQKHLENEDLAARMGAAGTMKARQMFNLEALACDTEGVCKQALAVLKSRGKKMLEEGA